MSQKPTSSSTSGVVSQPPASAQQLGLLQTRVRDMTTQLDVAIKSLLQENAALRKQIADLTAKQQASTQQTSKQ